MYSGKDKLRSKGSKVDQAERIITSCGEDRKGKVEASQLLGVF
jgi:hypothetical protein